MDIFRIKKGLTMLKKKTDDRNRKSISKQRKSLFMLLSLFLPIALLLVVEIFLRLMNYGENFSLFINLPGEDTKEHRVINPKIGKKYFQTLTYSTPCHDMFLAIKPENSFRIFVLGSSTVLGFPYDENLMFTRILNERLQDSYPERKIEVINTALTAINSFTLLDFTKDIFKEEPDAILIYAGHNEFYGALGIGSLEKISPGRSLTLLHLKLLSSRFYQLLRNIIVRMDNSDQKESGTLMKIIAENKEIPYKSNIYNKAIERYEKNMGKLLLKAKRRKIPVFFSEMVSNIKDLKPFCSVTADGYPTAVELYQEGVTSEVTGDYTKAKVSYYLAKDLDCIRFRASEEINDAIQRLTRKHGAILVPMKTSFFEQASPHEIIGNNLITEHVHPNIDGYFLMADAFFYSLAESKLLNEKLNSVYYKNSAYYQRNWGYTEIDSLLGVHRVNSLLYQWPFQSLNAEYVDYREIYRPTSLADSLAFEIIRSPGIRTHEAHENMASYYVQNGDYFNASREYHAALRCNPYNIKYYVEAVNCLIKINDLPLALKLIDKSLELKETYFGYIRKGELLMMKAEYYEAGKAFEKALKLDETDQNLVIILQKLHEALYYSGNEKKASEILGQIHKTDPHFKPDYSEKRPEFVNFVPVQVEKQIIEASVLYRNGNDDAALPILLKTLEVKETSIANRIIGDILSRKKDKNAIIYYLKAYPDYQNNIDFLYDLGILYLKFNLKAKANEISDKMSRLDAGNRKTKLFNELLVSRAQTE